MAIQSTFIPHPSPFDPCQPCWPLPADNWHWRYALERENARLRRENEALRRANDALRREAMRRDPPFRMPLPVCW